ncbi:MAG TPA: DUF2867 domain-containing protein [Actinomycetota bacterium]|nr:DUF2867 domain-containing protein [Actinomycetota bacterium]
MSRTEPPSTRVIDRIAHDFELLDVWPLPVTGRHEEFDDVIELIAAFDPKGSGTFLTRALFLVRHLLGTLLGWDDPAKERLVPGTTERTLRDRLPDDLRIVGAAPHPGDGLRTYGFAPLYRTGDEWAAEISNDTVHGVLHLGWLREPGGLHRAHLSVYVKPRGALGRAYLMLIQPFRHLLVYPALLRVVERRWEASRGRPSGHGPRD